MTEVVFSNKMHLMTSPETRPVVHNIARMMDRVAVTAQIPWVREWAPWNLDRLLIMPSSVLNTFKFHNKASEMASGRVKRTESDLKDVYKNVLDAKDPETGESLQTPELLAETGVLIVAGRSPVLDYFDRQIADFLDKDRTRLLRRLQPRSSISLGTERYTTNSRRRFAPLSNLPK